MSVIFQVIGSGGNCLATEVLMLPKGALHLVLVRLKRVIRPKIEKGATFLLFCCGFNEGLYSVINEKLKFVQYSPNSKELRKK